MVRLLVGFLTDGTTGGIDNYIMQFLEITKEMDIHCDLLCYEKTEKLQHLVVPYGSELHVLSSLKRPFLQYRQMCRILRHSDYDGVYLNISTAIDCPAAMAAKHCKVNRVLIHSHSGGINIENPIKRWLFHGIHDLCKPLLYRSGTDFYACSSSAGVWLFPRTVPKPTIIYNAVDLEKFAFDSNVRERVRKEFGFRQDALVVGHAGSFYYAKNHPFLLEVFAKAYQKNTRLRLLLIGDGINRKKMEAKAKKLSIDKVTVFAGWREDVAQMYQAMDIYVMPSIFEGLPISGVEAQCTGLPCFFSNNISQEGKVSEKSYFLTLQKGASWWARQILTHIPEQREAVKPLKQMQCYTLAYHRKQLEKLAHLK